MPLFTICLPVRNAQATLEGLVEELIEVVHDLVPRFEIVVLDNGSTDATPEIAHELSMRYPQVRRLAFPLPVSREMTLRAAIQETRGDMLLVRDPDSQIEVHEIYKLWQEFAGRDAVLACSLLEKASGWMALIERLGQGGKRAKASGMRLDYVLIRRRAFDAFRAALTAGGPLADELRRFGHPFVELTMKSRGIGEIPELPAQSASRNSSHAGESSPPAAQRVRRPNYLGPIKNFALGE
ncbi:MAG: glycosyltransferase [Pirellulales bacterium]|nr:glycosyltransferase [Pirellulales bacterium]